MKKHLYSLFVLVLLGTGAFAQYCGNSGPTVCTPGNLPQPGLSPEAVNLPPFINGAVANTTIHLKNFNQIVYPPFGTLTVQSLTIDTISNLPAGLCWSTNKANNTFANSEDGCILVSGTTCAPPGQYKMYIIVTVNVGISQQVNADQAGLRYWLRVNNNGDATVALDTSDNTAFKNAGYSPTAICTQCPTLTFNTTGGVQNTSCATPNGAFTTVASGGASPYTYTFSGGAATNTTGTFTGLNGGTYTVTATDANSCSGTTTAVVTTTTPTIGGAVGNNTANTLCTGGNGSFSIAGSGGTSPYTYAITGSSNSTGSFTNLAAGAYVVTVTDVNSCSGTASVTIANNPPTVTVTTSSTTPDTLCNGNSGGFVLSATGATGPYTYAFSGNSNTTGSFSGLAGGAFTVTVTSSNGCTTTQNVTVPTQTATVTVTTSSTNASSASSPNGSATATPTGGSAPYTFTWSNAQTTQTAVNVLPGSYTVTATDANGCSASQTVTVGFNSGIANTGEVKTLNVFPNPASTTLNINATLNQTSDVVIELVNSIGAKVLSVNAGRTDAVNETMDVRNLSKGVYHLRLLVNGSVSTQTLVIE
jgi:hypothetical protein